MNNRFNKKNLRILSVLFFAMLFLPAVPITAQESVQKNQLKFGRLLRLVDGYYVDSANVDKLTEKAIVHLLSELDPHSVYISKEEVDKMNEPLQGNFEGIGITFNIFKDTLLVTDVIPGGPAEMVGVRAGDRIVEVNEKNIAGTGIKNSDVFDLLRGEKGTTVEIQVLRRSSEDLLDFAIVRDKIPIYSLDASYMLDKETGLIKLNRFSATTTEEFIVALNELKSKNMRNLILDLRGNGGGYLKTAIEISDQFLDNNKLIVYTNGNNDPKREYKATSDGNFKDGNLVVLVDESSASASEIVSGAVQDWDRGLIIGRRSFGKGLVQKPYFLTDGSMVRLTTAHYYTPSGRGIQKPYNNGIDEYRRDYMARLSSGQLFSADSVIFPDSLKYKTLNNGRDVYGGGGIMPDVFIPIDTVGFTPYYGSLRRNNIIYEFVLDYIDNNRSRLIEEYPLFESYKSNFDIDAEMIEDIVAEAEKQGIERDEESLNSSLDLMKKELKALIARDIFTRNEFYEIIFQDDTAVKKALEVIENKERYNNLLVSAD